MTDRLDIKAERELEAFFQSAQVQTTDPSPDLLARILDDAYAAQDASGSAGSVPDIPEMAAPRRKWWASLSEAIGGWPAVAGLATAAMAGIWIGYSPPAAFDTLSESLLQSSYGLTMNSSLPDYSTALADG